MNPSNFRQRTGCCCKLPRFVLILFLSILTAKALASEAPDLTQPKIIVPNEITGVKTLLAEDVVNLATSLPDLIIIDARITDDRKYGYIEGSLSLPDVETNCESLSKVIPNKNTPTMFYCNGIECGRSVVSIKIAKSCGYTDMYWFRGGFAEWQQKGFQYAKDR